MTRLTQSTSLVIDDNQRLKQLESDALCIEMQPMHIAETSKELLDELRQSYRLSRLQSVTWFRWTLVIALAGFVLIAIGIILTLVQQTATAVANSIAGTIAESLALIFFKQLRIVNQRQDRHHRDLIKRQQILDAVHFARLISKQPDRDKITELIIKQSLHLR